MLHRVILTVISMIYKRYFVRAILLIILPILLAGCQNEQREVENMETVLDSLSRALEAETSRNDSLMQIRSAEGSTNDIPVYFKREFDTIENPESYIANALRQQREKIPIEAVLGGNMEYRQIEVLTEDWVLAVYDDGHVQGKSIFKYELQKDGTLKFTEIASRLPNER